MSFKPFRAAVVGGVGLAAWLCGPAAAQEGGLAGVLGRLRSADWSERQAATEALVASGTIGMREIEAALASEGLTAEQRTRLTGAAVARYRSEPLAGLGVQFGNSGKGAVQIAGVVAGFPASEVLRSGDVILAVGEDLVGGLIGGQDDLRAEILSRRPGEVMPVLVRRGLETIRLDLPLGEYANLQGAAALEDSVIRRAMRVRGERDRRGVGRGSAGGAAIGSGLDMAAWVDGAFPDGTWEGLVGGGERREVGVVMGGIDNALAFRNRQMQRLTFWEGVDDALREGAEQTRDAISASMTAGVVMRSVFLEHIASLETRIEQARAGGEDASGLVASLARVRGRLGELDATLLAQSARLEAAQRRLDASKKPVDAAAEARDREAERAKAAPGGRD